MPTLIDVHTHLQFAAFDKDRDEVVKRAIDQNIWVINIGANKQSSQKAVEMARKYSIGVLAAVGLHPNDIDEGFDYEFYKDLAQEPKVVAIGECGLDYYRAESEKEKSIRQNQQEVFIKHIKLASETKKPLMIHCRAERDFNPAQRGVADAFNDLIAILKSYNLNLKSPGIIHFFTGTLKDAKQLLEMNFYFTFGGLITFNRSFDEIIRYLPLERILLETDAPYVAPEPYRSKRNEPAYIVEVAKKLAEIKNISFEKVAQQTTVNALDIFKLLG